MKKTSFFLCFLLAALLTCLTCSAHAAQASAEGASIEAAGFDTQRITDAARGTWSTAAAGGASVTVSRPGGIGALYLEFDRLPPVWTLADPQSGQSVTCGENAFLHEFVDVSSLFSALPEQLTLSFPEGTVLADLYVFSEGELPDWVQVWQPPCEQADLLLLSSHSDDEQLFFAGVLPYYAIERALNVQVVYLVQHFQVYDQLDHQRPHEQLDGLWTVGVRNYPEISQFPDLYSESTDRAEALSRAVAVYGNMGYSQDDFVGFITECIRRFKPLVIVSHDLNGEYGHGTHVLCADSLGKALSAAADPDQYPESAAAYGTWTVEKTYLHLYEENQIVMDFDTPLDSLGGKTPFEMTQDGFACHTSQHWTWFYRWIYGTADAPITRADQIDRYSPCLYGLYDTQVGPDTAGGDFFEHVETYAQRAEAERLAAEEAARAAEEAARAQAEQEAAQQAQAGEPAASAQPGGQAEEPFPVTTIVMAAVLLACIVLAVYFIRKGRRKS